MLDWCVHLAFFKFLREIKAVSLYYGLIVASSLHLFGQEMLVHVRYTITRMNPLHEEFCLFYNLASKVYIIGGPPIEYDVILYEL